MKQTLTYYDQHADKQDDEQWILIRFIWYKVVNIPFKE